MALDSIIFIHNTDLSPYKYYAKETTFCSKLKQYFSVPAYHLPIRILLSLVPPVFGKPYQKVYVDLLGPCLALLVLIGLLHYGHASKVPLAAAKISPSEVILVYFTLMPLIGYILGRVSQSRISFLEMVSMLGYSIYGFIFTLVGSLLLYDEESNLVFFVCMLVFGGLSTLRIVLILVALIPKPGLRLIICSIVSILQLLFLIGLHFVYMHRTYSYGRKNRF